MNQENYAKELFTIKHLYETLEDEMFIKILVIMGYNYSNVPFEDITYDPYDNSFELLNAKFDVELSKYQMKQLHSLGFDRCWICFPDNSETYYNFLEN